MLQITWAMTPRADEKLNGEMRDGSERRVSARRDAIFKVVLSIVVMLEVVEEMRFANERMERAVRAWLDRLEHRDSRHVHAAELGYLIRHIR
jgi:hypothetical protein